MAVRVVEIEARSILTPQKMGSLSSAYDFSLNPYAGCAFSCSYCYVPKFPNKRHGPSEWGTWVEVKVNAPELIARDRTLVFGSKIFFSSATDPYQYLELKYRLSRRCLQALAKYGPSALTMHTRSHLILQDLELLRSFGRILKVGVSITTDDEQVRQQFEPSAPSIARRLQIIKTLRQEGIDVFASVAPLLPCDPDRLIALLKPYVTSAWVDEMRWTEVNNRPELLSRYADFFQPDKYLAMQNQIAEAFHRKNRRNWREPVPVSATAGAAQAKPVYVQTTLF